MVVWPTANANEISEERFCTDLIVSSTFAKAASTIDQPGKLSVLENIVGKGTVT